MDKAVTWSNPARRVHGAERGEPAPLLPVTFTRTNERCHMRASIVIVVVGAQRSGLLPTLAPSIRSCGGARQLLKIVESKQQVGLRAPGSQFRQLTFDHLEDAGRLATRPAMMGALTPNSLGDRSTQPIITIERDCGSRLALYL